MIDPRLASPDTRRILLISPHPDDETLGCGGTIALASDRGDDVLVVFLTDGEAGLHDAVPTGQEDRRISRRLEARSALDVLGVADSEWWSEPDGFLAVSDQLVDRLAQLIHTWAPTTVLAPHPAESHADHRASSELAIRSCPAGVELLAYEVWTPLAVVDEVVDITAVEHRKRAAIRCYTTQIEHVDFEDALLGLARYRGAFWLWEHGVNTGRFAEGFARLSGVG